jgi:hypothetical protein
VLFLRRRSPVLAATVASSAIAVAVSAATATADSAPNTGAPTLTPGPGSTIPCHPFAAPCSGTRTSETGLPSGSHSPGPVQISGSGSLPGPLPGVPGPPHPGISGSGSPHPRIPGVPFPSGPGSIVNGRPPIAIAASSSQTGAVARGR